MSPQNRSLIAGLAAPGLIWLATSVAVGQVPPAPQGPTTPAPTTYAALLLSNGKVIRGEIVEDTATRTFRHRQSGGTVSYPKLMVEKAASSVEELYQFRVSRLPTGDPDERMKLARWCLTEHLTSQAREQVEAVLAMCPGDVEADRMYKNLQANAGRYDGVDPDVRRTSGEMPRADIPAALDPGFLRKAQGRFNALPVIFDLPPAQAVRRANEFADFVQPILQQNCAKCHNEQYPGSFQLVEIKVKRDWKNPDIARSNLDATLRLVNPDDPSRSDLLSAGLVPHGPNKNAIFRGPNDRQYLVVVAWVKSLRPAGAAKRPAADDVARTGFTMPEPAPGDGFATDRGGRIAPTPAPPSPSNSSAPRASLPTLPGAELPSAAPPPPSRRVVKQYEENAEFYLSAGDNPEFPIPYSAGGPAPGKAAPTVRKPAPTRAPTAAPVATPVTPDAVVVEADNPNNLPGMDKPLYPTSPTADTPRKKATPKIDNALLEQMMKNRNNNP